MTQWRLLCWRLAGDLCTTPGRVISMLSSRELAEWAAFYALAAEDQP